MFVCFFSVDGHFNKGVYRQSASSGHLRDSRIWHFSCRLGFSAPDAAAVLSEYRCSLKDQSRPQKDQVNLSKLQPDPSQKGRTSFLGFMKSSLNAQDILYLLKKPEYYLPRE